MPAKDIYHDCVRTALIKDGWTITHDPLRLIWGPKDMYVDLGAERLLAAEKPGRRIAVEIKSFQGRSEMTELERAIGQYTVYRTVLDQQDPDRLLFLAVPAKVLVDVFEDPLGKLLIQSGIAKVMGFDPVKEEIIRWLP